MMRFCVSPGARWLCVSTEVVRNGTEVHRHTVYRECTVHFSNGPWQEFRLSTIPLMPSPNACREPKACEAYIDRCDELAAEIDTIKQLTVRGKLTEFPHLDRHEDHSTSSLCPCTCSMDHKSKSSPSEVPDVLQQIIDNVTDQLQGNDRVSDRTSFCRVCAFRRRPFQCI